MANPSAASPHDEDNDPDGLQIPSLPPSGPRKLIRPSLPPGVLNRRPLPRRAAPLLSHQQPYAAPFGHSHGDSSHAEVLYLQKQVHAQTPMVFVLEEGERVEGVIEWFDTHAIKVRRGGMRTLIYKSAIKYLHKAAEPRP